MDKIGEILLNLWGRSGIANMVTGFTADGGWQNLVMIIIACVLLYLAIVKKFEPLLLMGIAFGCLLANLPGAGMYNQALWDSYVQGIPYEVKEVIDGVEVVTKTITDIHFTDIFHYGGLLDFFYIGVKSSWALVP